jgi:hypothetical protein
MSSGSRVFVWIVGAAVGAVVFVGTIFVAAFVVFYVVAPRRVIARYDAFTAAHPVGSDVDSVMADPFTADAMDVWLTEGNDPTTSTVERDRVKLRAALRERPRGHLHVMWIHTPPFGRVGADFTFENGKVTELRKTSLD